MPTDTYRQIADELLAGRELPGWPLVTTASSSQVYAGKEAFIKIFPPQPWRAFCPDLLRGAIDYFFSRAARLARTEQRMRARNLNTPRILRVFELRQRQVLVTERVAGETVHELLPLLRGNERFAFVRALAAAIAKLHSLGITHGDLNRYNVLALRISSGSWRFTFLDNENNRFGRWGRYGRLRNLSKLNYWGKPGPLQMTDRLRFLNAYLETVGKKEELASWWRALTERFAEGQRRAKRPDHS